jgi:hypothetical protein
MQRNRKVVLFRGIANIPEWRAFYPSLQHFIHQIPAIFPRRHHDYLVAQSFMHRDFIDDPGPKVFFCREPDEILSDETVRNLAACDNSDTVLSFSEPDPDRRMYYVALPMKRGRIIRFLESTLEQDRPRFCCIVNRYKTNDQLELLQKRYDFVAAMGQDIDIYGQPPATGPNRWNDYPSYQGAAGDKLSVLSSYTFNLCFESCDRDGYITEKLPQALMAGCVPLYWGGGRYLEETIPPACYIDCRGHDPATIYARILAMGKGEIVAYRRAGLDFLASKAAERFCWRYWAGQCIERWQSQQCTADFGTTRVC